MFTLDLYTVKAIEYLTGIAFLLLFVLFWRYVNTDAAPAPARAWSAQIGEWFRVPERLFFHPAHAWARVETPDVVTIGVNDFAQQLVGRIDSVDLPQPGMTLEAGKKGWTLRADGRAVDMLAPVGGRVLAVNTEAAARGDVVNREPYDRGWLLKVQAPRIKDEVKGLVSGAAARQWIARVTDELMASMSPELGYVLQDGGVPVHGIARSIDEANWDEVARRFLEPEGVERVEHVPPSVNGESGNRVGRVIFSGLLVFFLGGWATAVMAQSLPKLPAALVLLKGAESPGPVTFNHDTHVDSAKPACTNCHPREFRMLKTTKRVAITHPEMEKGKYCGSCHDGKKAFAMDDCTMCHQQ
jgi:c(7)-type cytochrome triheme protein